MKVRLIAMFASLILVISVLFAGVSIIQMSNGMKIEAEVGISAIVSEGTRIVRSRLDIFEKELEIISHNEKIKTMDWDIQSEDMKHLLEISIVVMVLLWISLIAIIIRAFSMEM